jgi:hypothetical protein
MSDTATKNGLEVVTIDSIFAKLLAQSISQWPLPDGDTRHNFGTIDTDSLQKFKDGIAAKSEGESREDQIYLQVWVPHRKDGNGYLQLTDLINSKKAAVPMPDAQGDIDKYLQWRKEVNEPTEDFGPYTLRIHLSGGIRALVEGEEKEVAGLFETIRCTLYDVGSGLVADVGGLYFYVPDTDESSRQIVKWYNAKLGMKTPAKLTTWAKANRPPEKERPPIDTADAFPFHTSQEMDILNRAQCDGKTYAGYFTNEQAGMIAYQRTGTSYSMRLALTEDERAGGLTMDYLENLVRAQDADAVIATAYILGVLAPPAPLPARALASGWIDFNDVIKKIGWNPQTTKARREMHGRLWDFIKYGERAHIVGKRSIKYKDAEHNEIDTTIHGAAWRVMKTETPDSEPNGTPISVEIAVSRELTALITHPKTTQYLPMAEILGAIPGGQPSGAWARVIGVALMAFWRINPRATISGTIQPTRRELLDHFTAKVNPYNEVLASNDPRRAIDYWCDALQILADGGFIERTGEAAITAKQMRAALPRQNWQRQWLDQTVNIEPGAETLKPAIEERTKALHEAKPRDLKKKPRTKRKPKI